MLSDLSFIPLEMGAEMICYHAIAAETEQNTFPGSIRVVRGPCVASVDSAYHFVGLLLSLMIGSVDTV